MACCPLRALIQRRRRVFSEGHDDSSPALQCSVCIKKDDPSRKGRSNTTFSHKRSIVPSGDGFVLSSLFPAINCRATFNSPFGVCWTLLGENALGFSGEAVIADRSASTKPGKPRRDAAPSARSVLERRYPGLGSS